MRDADRIQFAADWNREARNVYGVVAVVVAALGLVFAALIGFPSGLALLVLAALFAALAAHAHSLLRRLQREGGAR